MVNLNKVRDQTLDVYPSHSWLFSLQFSAICVQSKHMKKVISITQKVIKRPPPPQKKRNNFTFFRVPPRPTHMHASKVGSTSTLYTHLCILPLM